jgi:formate hydrogenlyase subunit 3/multisubunit Na+/H+ antiporter MnhD subunit
VQAGHLGYALWAVIVSVLTLALFAYVMKQAFFGALRRRWRQVREVPRAMRAAMLALVVVCVSGGLLLLPAVRPMFLQPAVAVVGNGTGYSGIVLGDIRP